MKAILTSDLTLKEESINFNTFRASRESKLCGNQCEETRTAFKSIVYLTGSSCCHVNVLVIHPAFSCSKLPIRIGLYMTVIGAPSPLSNLMKRL